MEMKDLLERLVMQTAAIMNEHLFVENVLFLLSAMLW